MLVTFIVIFYGEGAYVRRNKVVYSPSEKARNAYRRWVGLVCFFFFFLFLFHFFHFLLLLNMMDGRCQVGSSFTP